MRNWAKKRRTLKSDHRHAALKTKDRVPFQDVRDLHLLKIFDMFDEAELQSEIQPESHPIRSFEQINKYPSQFGKIQPMRFPVQILSGFPFFSFPESLFILYIVNNIKKSCPVCSANFVIKL